ncbi:hypothetical protein VTN49DRAFT_967 [Thermomyces lanuginosus]|uniref:uncharacterized protein n=1 Tax=Thermomyces lanuginosus TaxID=5541 RepID=UPI003743E43C
MLSLVLSAELQGVTDLRPKDTAEDPYYYTFKVQCSSCRETHPNWVSFTRFDSREIPGSRGEANFVWKCKLCGRTHTANITAGPHTYVADNDDKVQKIIELECRGLEFTEFKPEGEWEAKGVESNTAFTSIDLTEGEWYDYDEKAGEEVSIKDVSWEIRNVK